MPSMKSTLRATEIDSRGLRAVSGGLAGGLAALVAFSVTDSFVPRILAIVALTLLFMLVIGYGYNLLAGGE
jgi:uncharacterized membrane protein